MQLTCARRLAVRELQQQQLQLGYEIHLQQERAMSLNRLGAVQDLPAVYESIMNSWQEMTPASMTSVVQNSLAAANITADAVWQSAL